MKSLKNTLPDIKSVITLILGTVLAAYGITLAIHAGFGGATLAILWQGVSKVFHVTLGTSSFIIAVVMLLFVLFLDKKQIFWGTILYQLVYSPMVDISKKLIFYSDSRIINLLLMLLGILLFSAGTGIYSSAEIGKGPYEALTFALHNRTGAQIRTIRILFDFFFVVVGYFLGGQPGICTIFALLLSGPLIQFFYKMAGNLSGCRIFFLPVFPLPPM